MSADDYIADSEILNAIELVDYVKKFSNYKLVIAMPHNAALDKVLLDIKFLNIAAINYIIVCQIDFCKGWSKTQLKSLKINLFEWEQSLSKKFNTKQASVILEYFYKLNPVNKRHSYKTKGKGLIVALNNKVKIPPARLTQKISKVAILLTKKWQANKLFYLTGFLTVDEKKVSHIAAKKLGEHLKKYPLAFIKNGRSFNIRANKLLESIEILLKNQKTEAALMNYSSGAIFYELFTHRGVGTLISNQYKTRVRQAKKSDFLSILQILIPYFNNKNIIKINYEEMMKNLERYLVYEVDDKIVGCATLNDYGKYVELAKFSTLPRYRGRGIARDLALNLLTLAKKLKKSYVFSLSIDPIMWALFRNLGFLEEDRAKLPVKWQKNYDFERPSKAFIKKL